jgi:hypothetical protein
VSTEGDYPSAAVDGFEIGIYVSYDECGDAWVLAPDGSAASLIWELGDPVLFEETIPPDPNGRWGTYSVRLPLPLTSDAEAAAYLTALLPELVPRWERWRRERGA